MSTPSAAGGGSLGDNVPPVIASANRDKHTVVGTGIGNALEWFDWSIYSTFAPFFAASFFFPGDPLSAFLSALVVFAVGFIARPVGGFLFGRISDRLGRKRSLALTVAAGSLGSLLIGVSPTYGAIGVLASVVLVLARIIQGLAHGGEQPAAQAYLAEAAPAPRRGLWATLIYFSGTIGATSGILLGAILASTLGREAMFAWGWRIPFLIGAVGGLYALYMRLSMKETEQFVEQIALPQEHAAARPGLWRTIWTHRRSAAQVVGMTVGVTVIYYFWVVSASAYSIAVLGANPSQVLIAGVAANVIFLGWLPLWGILSDRIGRKPVMYIGILGSAVALYPLSQLIDGNAVHLFLAITAAGFFIAAPCAISPALMCELFPTRIRTIGVAVPFSIAIAVFGGTTPYLQTWLSTAFGPAAFTGYVIALLLVSALTVSTLPETRGRVLTDDTADFVAAPRPATV